MPTFLPSQPLDQVYSKKKKTEIVIPAWDDIIHLTPEPVYTSAELNLMEGVGTRVVKFGRDIIAVAADYNLHVAEARNIVDEYKMHAQAQARRQQAAINMLKSPTPQLANNLGVIMTALDDVQDFTTSVGVVFRLLGRVAPILDTVAVGAFTVGAWLNRLNMMNRLTGGETATVCRLVRELGKTSSKTLVKADVDKRMRRALPSKGEVLEVLQTTDNLFGVGISLGPIVGLAQDAIFGAFTGAPIRFKEWSISDRVGRVLQDKAMVMTHPDIFIKDTFTTAAKWMEAASNVTIAGEYIKWQDFATGLLTTMGSYLSVRGEKIKEAVISTVDIISGQKAKPKKHTSIQTRFLLERLGIDSYRQPGWPVEGLGDVATMPEIVDAYSAQAQKVLHFWRNKLGVSDEGLFLDACVKEIGMRAADMFCAEGGVISESLDPHALIFVHALENNLNPPPDTSDEKFTEWISFIKQQIDYYDISVPTLRVLQNAYNRFFAVPL